MEFLSNEEVGSVIKRARIYRNMTQAELGEKLGVQAAAIQKWESGKVTNIKREMLRKLSLELRIEPALLIGMSTFKPRYYDFSNEEIKRVDQLIEQIREERKER